jgi:hypothetical protein
MTRSGVSETVMLLATTGTLPYTNRKQGLKRLNLFTYCIGCFPNTIMAKYKGDKMLESYIIIKSRQIGAPRFQVH